MKNLKNMCLVLIMGSIFFLPQLAFSQSLDDQIDLTSKEKALEVIKTIRKACGEDDQIIKDVTEFLENEKSITESSSGYQDVSCVTYHITYETKVSSCYIADHDFYEYSMTSDNKSVFGAFQKISRNGKCRLNK